MTRREASATVRVGSSKDANPDSAPEYIHHLSGEVSIEVSGADADGDDVWQLTREIEDAVAEAVENYEAGK